MSRSGSTSHFWLVLALWAGFAGTATTAFAQGDRVGLPREQMWRAPTAEDWKKPVLIKWERTWADAQAVSKETGKPILICINMDGEIASEHYAGVRYRQKEIAPLYKPYVCVIASVYRHNPRDYDDQGRRIPCPRFGGVTCGEHIWIEPIIYEKFCNGERVAPRHICVDLKGKEVYDVYFVNDTAGVFDAIRDGRKKLPAGKTIVRGDRPIVERVGSRASEDREAVEAAYRKGDAATRKALLDAALKHRSTEQLDLLRLAIFGLDLDLSKRARTALRGVQSADGAGLVADALRVPMDKSERDALVETLKRLGKLSPRARWLAGVHTGLAGSSTVLETKGWTRRGGGGVYRAPFGGSGNVSHIERTTRAALEKPDDPKARIDLAEATLAIALKAPQLYPTNRRMARMASRYLFADAKEFAQQAQKIGAPKWRVNTVLALAAYYGGDKEGAYPFATAAVKELPPGDTGWNSMAVVTIFAESRWKAIKKAVREGAKWPSSWLADLHAAYTILLRHPFGTDSQVLWHYELLEWLGARFRAHRILQRGLERFKDSPRLHEQLRKRIMKYQGAAALETAYQKLVRDSDEPDRVAPFAGVASVTAAESYRRIRRYRKAMEAYARAIAYFERAIAKKTGNRVGSEHAIALALAGRARVAFQLQDDETALREILASFARRPASAGARDRMGITPGETAQVLLARLRQKKKDELATRLDAALKKLDQELLRPDRGLNRR